MNKGGKKMKKILSVVLALLMLCASILVAFAATARFSVIDDTYASATRTLIKATLGSQLRLRFTDTAAQPTIT